MSSHETMRNFEGKLTQTGDEGHNKKESLTRSKDFAAQTDLYSRNGGRDMASHGGHISDSQTGVPPLTTTQTEIGTNIDQSPPKEPISPTTERNLSDMIVRSERNFKKEKKEEVDIEAGISYSSKGKEKGRNTDSVKKSRIRFDERQMPGSDATRMFIFANPYGIEHYPLRVKGDKQPLKYIPDGNMILDNNLPYQDHIKKLSVTIIKENWTNWAHTEHGRLNDYFTELSQKLDLHSDSDSSFSNLTQEIFKSAVEAVRGHIDITSETLAQVECDFHFTGRKRGLDQIMGSNTTTIEETYNKLMQLTSDRFKSNRENFMTTCRNITLRIAELKDTQASRHREPHSDLVETSSEFNRRSANTSRAPIETGFKDRENAAHKTESLLDSLVSQNNNVDITNPIPIPLKREQAWGDSREIPDDIPSVINDSDFRKIARDIMYIQSSRLRESIAKTLYSTHTEYLPGYIESRDIFKKVTTDILVNNENTASQIAKDAYDQRISESKEGSYKKLVDFITNTIVVQWSGIAALVIAIVLSTH
jgi:hypothetical protein